MAYTTANLLSSIERQSFAPANQSTFSTTDILALADEITRSSLIPTLLGAREEYYTTYTDSSIVSGTSAYPIPPRAIGAALREVHFITSSGSVVNLARVRLENLLTTTGTSSTPYAFYLMADSVMLYPTPNTSTGTLRLYFSVRPGDLVETTSAAAISAINTSTNVVTVTSIPSTWATGDEFDLISGTGSQNYKALDKTSTLVSGSDITFSSLPSDLAVGDYVSVSGTSPLIQMPVEFRTILATLTAADMLLAMNQPSGKALYAKGTKALESAIKFLTPRVVGESEVILPDWS